MRNLEGAKHAQTKEFMGLFAGDVLAFEKDFARIRGMQSGNHVEERCLSGSVRPNQSGDAALLNSQRSIFNSVHSAEMLIKMFNL